MNQKLSCIGANRVVSIAVYTTPTRKRIGSFHRRSSLLFEVWTGAPVSYDGRRLIEDNKTGCRVSLSEQDPKVEMLWPDQGCKSLHLQIDGPQHHLQYTKGVLVSI